MKESEQNCGSHTRAWTRIAKEGVSLWIPTYVSPLQPGLHRHGQHPESPRPYLKKHGWKQGKCKQEFAHSAPIQPWIIVADREQRNFVRPFRHIELRCTPPTRYLPGSATSVQEAPSESSPHALHHDQYLNLAHRHRPGQNHDTSLHQALSLRPQEQLKDLWRTGTHRELWTLDSLH